MDSPNLTHEKHDCRYKTSRFAPICYSRSKDYHAAHLSSIGEKHELTSAQSIKTPDWNERRKEIGDAVESGQ